MFEALRIFEVREPFTEEYQVPSVDTISDSGSGQVILPPPAPVIIDILTSGLTWKTVPGADSYDVESLVSGTLWSVVTTLPAPTAVQVIWTGEEWDIQQKIAGQWQVVYRGFEPLVPDGIPGDSASLQDIPTPDLIPTWYLPDGVTVESGIVVAIGDTLSPLGLTITGSGTPSVNTTYSMPGIQNGKNSYMGPDLMTYAFAPTPQVLYRVRAFNAAGPGPASNVVSLAGGVLDLFYGANQLASGDTVQVQLTSDSNFTMYPDNSADPVTILSVAFTGDFSADSFFVTDPIGGVSLPYNMANLAPDGLMVLNLVTPATIGLTGTMVITHTGVNSPLVVNLTTALVNFGIVGYSDGLISNSVSTDQPTSLPVWDGTFKFSNSGQPQTWSGWNNGGDSGYVPMQINGRNASCASISLGVSPVDNVTPAYVLQIWANQSLGFAPVWSGYKLDVTTPVGPYTNDDTAPDAAPALLTVAIISGTNTTTFPGSNCSGS